MTKSSIQAYQGVKVSTSKYLQCDELNWSKDEGKEGNVSNHVSIGISTFSIGSLGLQNKFTE